MDNGIDWSRLLHVIVGSTVGAVAGFYVFPRVFEHFARRGRAGGGSTSRASQFIQIDDLEWTTPPPGGYGCDQTSTRCGCRR